MRSAKKRYFVKLDIVSRTFTSNTTVSAVLINGDGRTVGSLEIKDVKVAELLQTSGVPVSIEIKFKAFESIQPHEQKEGVGNPSP